VRHPQAAKAYDQAVLKLRGRDNTGKRFGVDIGAQPLNNNDVRLNPFPPYPAPSRRWVVCPAAGLLRVGPWLRGLRRGRECRTGTQLGKYNLAGLAEMSFEELVQTLRQKVRATPSGTPCRVLVEERRL